MKRIAISLAAVLMCSVGAYAQSLGMSRIGEVIKSDGSRAYVSPATTVVVDVTVSRETVKTGPYARFAQKYFGVIAPLADKDVYSLVSAGIGYYDTDKPMDFTPPALPASHTDAVSHTGSPSDFPRVLPDRLSASGKSAEDAAADAAQTIFNLRKRRTELITGDYAETVYGAGLKAAIDRIDRMENEYLELFFGKQTTTTYTVRYYVTPSAGQSTAVVCRFKEDSGLLPSGDLSGEPIVLECRPTGVAESVYPAAKRKPVKSTDVEYAVADMVNVRVMFAKRELGSAEIPMYQYGVTTFMSGK